MKKALKVIALVLALAMVFAFASCKDDSGKNTDPANPSDGTTAGEQATASELDFSKIKVGFIFLHAPTDSTYDKNFQNAVDNVQKKLGLKDDQIIVRSNIPENATCQETAMELVDEGCDIIFADSFGHEQFMMEAAKEAPNVQFCHATGTHAKTAGLKNFHNAFASIYEGRYLAGVAAGMKINEMIEEGKITADKAKMGYVGAFPYAEVISGFTSFYLGAKSVCPTVTMEVKYTNSWFDETAEKTQAIALIDDGCVLISQHADSPGAPRACEEKGVPNVAYNVSTIDMGPNTAIISSKIDWTPYMELMITNVVKGEEIPADWCGGIAEGSVQLTELNTKVAAKGTQEKLDEVMAQFKAGTLHVFDTATFTVKGEKLTSYLADVIDEGDYNAETEAIKDGYFDESDVADKRSAPYFNIIIDGITAVVEK